MRFAQRAWVKHPVGVAGVYVALKVAVLAVSSWLLDSPSGFIESLSLRWDGAHYLAIAKDGYPSEGLPGLESPLAFPPLFPILIRLVGEGDLAPLIINSVAGAVATGLVAALMGWRAGLFFAAFPVWVAYSSVGYSEGLYVMLAAGALLLFERGHVVGGALVAALSPLARYSGAAAMAGYGLGLLRADRRRGVIVLAATAFAVAGTAVWHWDAGGTAVAYFDAQRQWGAELAWPWQQLDWYLHGWFTNQETVRAEVHPSYYALRNYAFVALAAYGCFLLLRRRSTRPLGLYAAVPTALTIAVVGTPAISTPRLLLAAFPAIAVLGDQIRTRAGWVTYGVVAFIGGCWVVTEHLTSFWA
jgi:hypothetical protein